MNLKINPFKENECVQDELTGQQCSAWGSGSESRALSPDCTFKYKNLERVQKLVNYSQNCIEEQQQLSPANCNSWQNTLVFPSLLIPS